MSDKKILVKSIRSKKGYYKSLILMYSIFILIFCLHKYLKIHINIWIGLIYISPLSFHYILRKIFNRVRITVTESDLFAYYGLKSIMIVPFDNEASLKISYGFFDTIIFHYADDVYKIPYIKNRNEINNAISKKIKIY